MQNDSHSKQKRQSEICEPYRMIFEHAPIGIEIYDKDGLLIDANKACLDIFGVSDLSHIRAFRLLDDPNISPENRRVLAGGGSVQYEVEFDFGLVISRNLYPTSKSGKIILQVTIKPIKARQGEEEGVLGFLVLVQDITTRREYEERLRKAEARWRETGVFLDTLINAIPIPIFYKDTEGRYTGFNRGFEEFFGLPRKELIGKTVFDISPRFLAECYHQKDLELFAHPGVQVYESHVKNARGEMRDVVFHKAAFADEQGNIRGLIGGILDFTEIRKTEVLLEEEKERLAVTLRSIGDGVITTDMDGKIVSMNRTAEDLTGWSAYEALGKPVVEVFQIYNETTRELSENPVIKVLRSGGIVEQDDTRLFFDRCGREYLIANGATPIRDRNFKMLGVVLVFRDTTERQRLMAHAQRTEKLESLGILAGGIAHDFNNLLGGLFGYLEMALAASPAGSKSAQYLENAFKAFARAKDLTQQLITFSKGGLPVKKIASPAMTIKDSAQFALSGSAVLCEFRIADDIWLCDFDENQIAQVINNLVLNAIQALPQGGKISVSAANVAVNPGESPSLAPGRYVRISVADSGAGIPKSILSRVFDPFFTTKPKGTGLGLATAYSIVRKHGGEIIVDATVNRGAVFHVFLPAVDQDSAPTRPVEPPKHKGAGRILVMDDEPIILETVSDILTGMGYQVEQVTNGTDALRAIQAAKAEKTPFRAAIMDLTIPGGMGGKDAISKLRETDTGLKVFVMSGYSDDPVMANPQVYGFNDGICKPFSQEEFQDLLNRHLG